MRSALGNPKVSAAQKKELFVPSVAARASTTSSKNLVAMLVDNHREVLIGAIAEQFEELKREHEQRGARAHHQRQPLDRRAARRHRRARSRSATARRSRPSSTSIPSLLGGARVQVGDQVIHASVRDALAQMAAALTR